MIELQIRRGEISLKEWQEYLDQLPDSIDKATVCKAFEETNSPVTTRTSAFTISQGPHSPSEYEADSSESAPALPSGRWS